MIDPHAAERFATQPLRATRVRYLIVGVLTLMAIVLYLHRVCLSFAERYIKEDLGLGNEQIGLVLSAFFWAYALGQVPGGWLGDRWGVRYTLALYIALWSLCTGLMGAATGFAVLLALRLGSGLAQAGAYPTSANLLSRWSPFAVRGFQSAIVSFGGRLGGTVAPVLTAYLLAAFVPENLPARLEAGDLLDVPGLMRRLDEEGNSPAARVARRVRERLPEDDTDPTSLLRGLNRVIEERDFCQPEDLEDMPLPREALALGRLPRQELSQQQVERLNRRVLEAVFPDEVRKLDVHGWRPVMFVYGGAGLLVALLFWIVCRDRPQDHPLCNAAEEALIRGNDGAPAGRARGLPIGDLLRSRSLSLSCISQFTTNVGWVFLVTWLPRYLAEAHRVPLVERGWMASVPLGVGMLGMLAGGWVTDRLTQAVGLRWGRCLPMALTRFVAMAAFLACMVLEAPWPATAALAVVAVATDLGTPAVWAFKQDVGGSYVGSILGWGNMWGNFGAAVSPLVLNAVVARAGWNGAFLTCAISFLLSGAAALGVDARVPVARREEG
jgi:sugar phosphate permease